MQRISVSKSSVSLWCREVNLTEAQAECLKQRKAEAGVRGRQRIAQLRTSGTLRRRHQSHVSSEPDGEAARAQEAAQIRTLYEGEQLGVREVAARLGVSFWRVYQVMQNYGIPRRRGSEQNYATYKTKPQFRIKSPLTPAEEQLRVAGTMLYWAEGTKTGHVVDFTNSDPQLIVLFMTFLRGVCRVAESRLRVLLYMYADQDMGRLKSFWSELTGIPLQQFIKPYVRELTPNVSHRKMAWGLVHIRYADTRLLQLLKNWGQEFAYKLTDGRAGT